MTRGFDLDAFAWEQRRSFDAVQAALDRRLDFPARPGTVLLPRELLGRLRDLLAPHGVEVVETEIRFSEVEEALSKLSSAVCRIAGGSSFLVLRRKRGVLMAIAPDGRSERVHARALAQSLLDRRVQRASDEIATLAQSVGLDGAIAQRIATAAERRQLENERAMTIWAFRTAATEPLPRLLFAEGVMPELFVLLTLTAIASATLLGGYLVFGKPVLEGRADANQLPGFALAIVTSVVCQVLAAWSRGRLTLKVSTQLKRRTFEGAQRLPLEQYAQLGPGQVVGKVSESQALEAAGFEGAVGMLTSLVALVTAVIVLLASPAPALLSGGLVACCIAIALITLWLFRARSVWVESRLALTKLTLENIHGHRTRLVQQSSEHWHDQEDRALSDYSHSAQRFDLASTWLAIMPRVWMVVAFALLVPSLIVQAEPLGLTLAVVGIILGSQALMSLVTAAQSITVALTAYRELRGLLEAGRTIGPTGVLTPLVPGKKLAELAQVSVVAPGTDRRVLSNVDATVNRGDHILLLGESGAGKSTLANLLTGLREPSRGLVLIDGLDSRSLSPTDWSGFVASAPQFQENFVFSQTVAFNALLGRRWPPEPSDRYEGLAIFAELGLLELVQRMPGQYLQILGEMGWQLSHGERSRLFIARALLQNARLVVFDESFGALDPETLEACIRCVLKRAETLVVIAHP